MTITVAHRPRLRRYIVYAAVIVLIIVVAAVVLPRIVSYGDVWDALTGLTWPKLAVLLAVTAINILTYGPSLMAALPGLRYRDSLAASLASSASTYIAPGGPTVGLGISYVMLRAWGFRRRAVTLALSLSLVWGQLVTLSFPPLALALLRLSGGRHPLLERVSEIGLALFVLLAGIGAVALFSGPFSRWVGDLAAAVASWVLRVIRRGPVAWAGEQLATFRVEALEVVRKRWHLLTLATLAGNLSVYLVLVVTLWAVGVRTEEVSLVESFAAWSLMRLVGGLPLTPGGIGFVEVGLTSLLIGFGGADADVVAAVLLYRFMTVAVPLVCGGVAGAMWRRLNPGEADIGGSTPPKEP